MLAHAKAKMEEALNKASGKKAAAVVIAAPVKPISLIHIKTKVVVQPAIALTSTAAAPSQSAYQKAI